MPLTPLVGRALQRVLCTPPGGSMHIRFSPRVVNWLATPVHIQYIHVILLIMFLFCICF